MKTVLILRFYEPYSAKVNASVHFDSNIFPLTNVI
ncbi:hypothetical protein BN3590_02250 [Clostridium sp. C105KSO15]|nr:hypothetical protein BN3590_02250 [Clostridium sp. C105KSO15]